MKGNGDRPRQGHGSENDAGEAAPLAPGLTVAMIVRDERENLAELLPVLVSGADDVIVVDTGSTDGSAEIARALGARVILDSWDDDFARARNRGLDDVRTSHVLWLDADDRIDPEVLARVRGEALARGRVGLFLLLVNEDADPTLVSSCLQLRVFPSDPRHRFAGRVHEQIAASLARTKTPTATIDAAIRHRGYVDPQEVARKARRNLRLLRREMEGDGARDLNVLYHFVKAASRAGEIGEALRVAVATIESPPPGSPDEVVQALRVLAGQLAAQSGRPEEARALLESAVRAAPRDPVARFFLAERLRSAGDLAGAHAALEAARALPIAAAHLPLPVAGLRRAIRLHLGEVEELLARPERALAAYEEILAASPDDFAARRAAARAHLALGRTREAVPALDALAAARANDPETIFLRASAAFLQGDLEEAKRRFEAALAADPRQWAAALHLGHLALRQGDLPSALAHYSKALALVENPETRLGMAACQFECGLVQECLEHLARVVELSAGRPLPPGTEALSAEALLRLGLPGDARDALEIHLRRFGPAPRILARLGDCYRALGEPAAARLGYEEALRLDPRLPEARTGLESLASV